MNDMSTYTRADAEAHVRSFRRVCRGPLPPETRVVVNALLAGGFKVAARHYDKHGGLIKDLPVKLPPEIQKLEEVPGRERCNRDFNDTICAGPFDGKEHKYKCGHCGVEGTYIAPFFNSDTVEVADGHS